MAIQIGDATAERSNRVLRNVRQREASRQTRQQAIVEPAFDQHAIIEAELKEFVVPRLFKREVASDQVAELRRWLIVFPPVVRYPSRLRSWMRKCNLRRQER